MRQGVARRRRSASPRIAALVQMRSVRSGLDPPGACPRPRAFALSRRTSCACLDTVICLEAGQQAIGSQGMQLDARIRVDPDRPCSPALSNGGPWQRSTECHRRRMTGGCRPAAADSHEQASAALSPAKSWAAAMRYKAPAADRGGFAPPGEKPRASVPSTLGDPSGFSQCRESRASRHPF